MQHFLCRMELDATVKWLLASRVNRINTMKVKHRKHGTMVDNSLWYKLRAFQKFLLIHLSSHSNCCSVSFGVMWNLNVHCISILHINSKIHPQQHTHLSLNAIAFLSGKNKFQTSWLIQKWHWKKSGIVLH